MEEVADIVAWEEDDNVLLYEKDKGGAAGGCWQRSSPAGSLRSGGHAKAHGCAAPTAGSSKGGQ